MNLSLPRLFELDELEVLHILRSSENDKMGILVASDFNNTTYKFIIRLYLVGKVDENYEVNKEIDAFMFRTQEEAVSFADELPLMTATDLLLCINKIK